MRWRRGQPGRPAKAAELGIGEDAKARVDRGWRVIEKRGCESWILVHHPQQETLSHNQAGWVGADVKDVLASNPVGIIGQEFPWVGCGFFSGDLEIAARTREVVDRSPLGQVVAGRCSHGNDHLNADRREEQAEHGRGFEDARAFRRQDAQPERDEGGVDGHAQRGDREAVPWKDCPGRQAIPFPFAGDAGGEQSGRKRGSDRNDQEGLKQQDSRRDGVSDSCDRS